MQKLWADRAWDDYLNWQNLDKNTLRKINDLIKDIERNGVECGIGKPERLRYRNLWSRRIDQFNRLVCDVDEQGNLLIVACKGHYEE